MNGSDSGAFVLVSATDERNTHSCVRQHHVVSSGCCRGQKEPWEVGKGRRLLP